MIVALEDAPGLPDGPGYYRVKAWPFYADGMIEAYMISDSLEKVAELDDEARRGEDDIIHAPCGEMCNACQEVVEDLLRK